MKKMKKVKYLSILVVFLMTLGCSPKEMVSTDPEFNFKGYENKNVLFVGFDSDEKLKISDAFIKGLDDSVYNQISNINTIKMTRYEETNKIKNSEINTVLEKYKASIMVFGIIKAFSEVKYIDNPTMPMYADSSFMNRTATNSNLRSLIKYNVNLTGNLYFVDTKGRTIWSQNIDDYQTVQFEESTQSALLEYDKNDSKIYSEMKTRLIDSVTAKAIKSLLPYYEYK